MPADEFAEEDLSFKWTITEFKEDQMTIQLDFAHPEDISMADRNDQVQVTFWGVEFFKS